MKGIHIGAHINTHSLVFASPIAKYITQLKTKLYFYCDRLHSYHNYQTARLDTQFKVG